MSTLARSIGLGLAARGDVGDVVGWARQVRDAGLDSVWIHDSYYERDAISYATAIARALELDGESGETGFRLALGAVNPNTRHPVVLAMTGSALDEILPGRIVMAIGTGLPLRLKQMGIPYSPETALAGVSTAIDQLRTLWRGERLPSATPGLPPIQPMFAPTHRIPIHVAAYRREFVTLAGQKADGYIARPAESIASLRGILERLNAAAVEAGRDPGEIETEGYLLSLVDSTRREALNRAKREPFVIYMMSILGDISLKRAGFDVELRDRISAAWKAEDYHGAGALIPDELLDAYMLCGTREDVAAKAMAFHAEAGLGLPLLQPVLQEDHQIDELVAAAALYAGLPEPASSRAANRVAQPVAAVETGGPATTEDENGTGGVGLADDRRLGLADRANRRLGAVWEILRPFAYTASVIPVLAGGAIAAVDHDFSWLPFVGALLGGMLLHSGTNIINEIYDVRKGIDTITSPRASHALLKARLTERQAFVAAFTAFGLAVAIGLYLIVLRGPAIVGLGLAGLLGGYFYTAPPFEYKYRALGVPLVFLLMGPLMVVGTYFAVTGTWSATALAASVPVGLLVTAILDGNEWRDINEDSRAGISTLSARLGRERAHYFYVALVLGAYMALGLTVAIGWLPPQSLLAIVSLPFLAQVIRSAELGATGQQRAIAMLDVQTARLHLTFGLLLVAGILLSAGALHG